MKKVFISYSHKDEELKNQFVTHLSGLTNRKLIEIWDDRQILIGEEWDEKIKTMLFESDIVIFLLSSDFLASIYINEFEIKKTIQRHNDKEVYLAPIFLRPCDFESSLLSTFQCIPRDAKFITKWDNIDSAFLEVVNELKKIIQEFKQVKKEIIESKKDNNIESEIYKSSQLLDVIKTNDESIEKAGGVSIDKIMEVLNQETNDLKYCTTKEDILKIQNLRIKIQEEFFKNIENQIDFVSSKKELMYSSVLFDTIYTSEILNTLTVNDIQKIRVDENKKFKWYDRSIVVSALSLSLINFKFDQKKANLLLDFVIDFEDNVWERALTGLMISIISQKNRGWLRAENFIKRLRTLQNNNEIQEGLKAIDFILKNELYKVNLFSPNLFDLELFKNPMNCFVPFYESNDVLITALDNADNEFDIEEFKTYLNVMPLMDSHKYALCIALNEGTLRTETLKNEKARRRIGNSLMISESLSPFQNLISEYFCFFNYFPKKMKDDLFEKQLLLIKTDLKTIVLNRKMQLLLEANTFLDNEKYPEAIAKYQELLKIEKNNIEARLKLGDCYWNKKEYNKALTIFIEFEKEINNEKDTEIYLRIARCYNKLGKYDESNKYCEKIEKTEKNLGFELLILKSENYSEQEDFINSERYCKKAEEKISDEEDMSNLAIVYNQINNNNDALRLIKKALEITQNNAHFWRIMGVIYCDLFYWELSLSALEKSIELDDKDASVLISLGRTLVLSKIDFTRATKLFEKALKIKSNFLGVNYGNFGHLHFIEGNKEMALEKYLKCIQYINDEKDFMKKMKFDLKFMLRIGIGESDYNSMILKVIDQYNLSKKNINTNSHIVPIHQIK